MAKATKEKVACDVCGKEYVPAYIAAHKRNLHGIHSRRSSKASFTSMNGATFTHVEGFVLLQDSHGDLWLAEKIR